MRLATCTLATAGFLALLTGLATAQNDMPIDNGGDVVNLYSSPTGGSPTGTIPPDITTADFYYQVYHGDRVLRHTDDATGAATIGVNGYLETLYDTDWSTTASFYDRSIGPAVPDSVCPEGRMPAFLDPTIGFTTEVFVSLGPSGFGSPCTFFPSFCSPTTSTCAPPGFVNGWGLGITLSSSIVVPSDGTGASDMANTYFLPSGMTHTSGTGTCGLGDYSMQDAHSIDESQADYLGGVGSGCGAGLSEFGGFASAGSGPIMEAVTSAMEGTLQFDRAITNAVADSGLGAGFESSWGGGGATNALNVPLSLGGAVLIAAEHRNAGDCGTPGPLVVGALSWTGEGGGVLPSPGIPVFGTWLLISPAGVVYTTTLSTWIAAGVTIGCSTTIFTEGVGLLPPFAIPAIGIGTDLGLQTGVMLSATLFDSGNAVLIKLR